MEKDLVKVAVKQVAAVVKSIHDSKSSKMKRLIGELGDIEWHKDPGDKLPPKVKVAQFVNPGAQVIYDMFKYLKVVHMVIVMRYLNLY